MELKEQGKQCIASGEAEEGRAYLLQYLDEQPNDVDALTVLAESYAASQENDQAVEYYTKALEIDPLHTRNLLRFSAIVLDGPNYLEALSLAHQRLNPQRYVEIGVCKGASFSLASPEIIAIGVDPEPQLDSEALPAKHLVISDTSDNYFSSGRIVDDLAGKSFDMAFLDGMHLFEYALRDFINLEQHANASSTVFVHDLYPMNEETARRDRIADFWSGDVWKLVVCLKEYRPDLEFSLLPCPPTGLGVITKLDSNSTVLLDAYDEILEKYVNLPFSVVEANKDETLSLVSADCDWLS